MRLEEFGWNSRWEGLRAVLPSGTKVAARIVAEHRGAFDAASEDGDIRLTAAGKLMEQPAVGDWVLYEPGAARIAQVLARENQISRREPGGGQREQVLAANVDVAAIVMGLDGDFNVRRLERYLVLTRESGARPLVVLSKADLRDDLHVPTDLVRRVAGGAPVVALSALHEDVVARLGEHLYPRESVALLGSSGAGKSTILNAILGEERQRTSAVRADDSRGRHTTTSRQLVRTPEGWLVFDLPGLREIQLLAGRESLEAAFGDIAEVAGQCRFRDCTHQGEPGCAVADSIDAARLASYHRLERELESLETRNSPEGRANEKRRWKAIHKSMRHHPKYNR